MGSVRSVGMSFATSCPQRRVHRHLYDVGILVHVAFIAFVGEVHDATSGAVAHHDGRPGVPAIVITAGTGRNRDPTVDEVPNGGTQIQLWRERRGHTVPNGMARRYQRNEPRLERARPVCQQRERGEAGVHPGLHLPRGELESDIASTCRVSRGDRVLPRFWHGQVDADPAEARHYDLKIFCGGGTRVRGHSAIDQRHGHARVLIGGSHRRVARCVLVAEQQHRSIATVTTRADLTRGARIAAATAIVGVIVERDAVARAGVVPVGAFAAAAAARFTLVAGLTTATAMGGVGVGVDAFTIALISPRVALTAAAATGSP